MSTNNDDPNSLSDRLKNIAKESINFKDTKKDSATGKDNHGTNNEDSNNGMNSSGMNNGSPNSHNVNNGSHGNQNQNGETSNPTYDKALEEAKNKAEENWNLFLRTRADMDNLRRRADIDVENARKFALEKFAREMIAVVDSLEHGLQVAESEHDAAYREGMTLTLKLCLDIFDKFGIVPINPVLGDSFDPIKHEAISMQVNNEIGPNKILLVAQKGFMLHDRLLRSARVIVSKSDE